MGLDGEGHITRGFKVGLNAVAVQIGGQAVEIILGEPLQDVHLISEVDLAVAEAVGQGGLDEAAVATAGPAAAAISLEQHDLAPRITGLGLKRCPQAGVAAAHDAQIRFGIAVKRGVRFSRRKIIEPEAVGRGVPVGRAILRGGWSLRPGRRHRPSFPCRIRGRRSDGNWPVLGIMLTCARR